MVATDPVRHAEPTTVTDEVRRQIRQMRRDGKSRDQIASELGISKSSVWHALNSYSLTEVAEMEQVMHEVRDRLVQRLKVHVLSGGNPSPIADEDFELVEKLNKVLAE